MTLPFRIVRPDDFTTMPWKNGRGATAEIARSPATGAGCGFDFDWRISVAPVIEDGSFSTFPGVERTIMVIDGAGMELELSNGRRHRLLPWTPFTYDGGESVHGRLIDGPVRDFNVMARTGAASGSLIVAESSMVLVLGSAATLIAYAAGPAWRARTGNLDILTIGEGCALIGAEPGTIAFERISEGRLAIAVCTKLA